MATNNPSTRTRTTTKTTTTVKTKNDRMLHELDDTTSLWLQDPVKNWREWPVAATAAADAAAVQDKVSAVDAGGLLEKVNEDKLARDVDDLSAIFEELADGVIDFPLPCDEDEDDDLAEATAAVSADGVGEWIDGLDSEDALNVDEISAAFDALVAEQEDAMSAADALLQQKDSETAARASYSSSEYDDSDEDMDEDDEDDAPVSLQIVPAPPVWASMAPLDPRSCITKPVFKNLDSRIPRVNIPRMDLALSDTKVDDAKPAAAVFRPVGPTGACLSPVRKEAKAAAVPEYRHDPATCWICKSSKTPERKRALHRFLEKRSRRNWKKGPRYSGRSNVAASRVRNGGRFICTTQWI